MPHWLGNQKQDSAIRKYFCLENNYIDVAMVFY